MKETARSNNAYIGISKSWVEKFNLDFLIIFIIII